MGVFIETCIYPSPLESERRGNGIMYLLHVQCSVSSSSVIIRVRGLYAMPVIGPIIYQHKILRVDMCFMAGLCINNRNSAPALPPWGLL